VWFGKSPSFVYQVVRLALREIDEQHERERDASCGEAARVRRGVDLDEVPSESLRATIAHRTAVS
jgi:hypothetical protein